MGRVSTSCELVMHSFSPVHALIHEKTNDQYMFGVPNNGFPHANMHGVDDKVANPPLFLLNCTESHSQSFYLWTIGAMNTSQESGAVLTCSKPNQSNPIKIGWIIAHTNRDL
jgi:hypothetical protein